MRHVLFLLGSGLLAPTATPSALPNSVLVPQPALRPALQGQEAGSAPREVMWKAPTRADWDKPCLITWQRTFDDAIAVAEA
ncbi:MAG TPA: hypothetical protein PLJ12_04490, partial [Planctomycetota bacterium]|nr:hypothetical protein [Planctomycetota bacterium]